MQGVLFGKLYERLVVRISNCEANAGELAIFQHARDSVAPTAANTEHFHRAGWRIRIHRFLWVF
jgi:hypothetical protein